MAVDDDPEHLDREQMVESGGRTEATQLAVEAWLDEHRGLRAATNLRRVLTHDVGGLLEHLADHGYRVEPIEASAIEDLLPAAKD